MKLKYIFTIIITALLLITSNHAPPPAAAQTPADNQVRLLSEDEQSILLELTTGDVQDIQVETVEIEGQSYQKLHLPETVFNDRPGEPHLPTRGTLLGLPTTAGVTVEVIEAETETLPGTYHLPPAPSVELAGDTLNNLLDSRVEERFVPAETIYGTDAFYPAQPVTLGAPGYLRDQAVAQVQFYPLQYNPVSGEVRLYRRLVVRVTWAGGLSATAADSRGSSFAYEPILQETLLNYDSLDRPAPSRPTSGTVVSPIAPLAATPTLKMEITEDGLYQLTHSDLTGAGFDLTGVDPRTLSMSNQGAEISIYVTGEEDGVFDPTDVILFYATGISGDIYTTKNIYWLTAGGGNGQRMSVRDGTPSGGTLTTNFPVTIHAEEDTQYWINMPNGEGQDHWFWDDRISPTTGGLPKFRDYILPLDNISTAGTATVRVQLKGFTGLGHRTKIYLNNILIDEQPWSGQVVFEHNATTPLSNLINGDNTIRVEAVDTGAAVDQLFVNWIELDYRDTYVAENDQLLFGVSLASTFLFKVTGFSSNTVDLFDVTDPAHVARITNGSVVADGGFNLQFKDTAQVSSRYLALTPAQRKTVTSLKLDEPSSWKSATNGADQIIITHKDFYDAAQRLADHRRALGLRVALVKIEDVYDEFSDGLFTPQAIRDFLAYAYQNWTAPAPSYVLLVGDGTFDYRDNLKTEVPTYIPTQMVETSLFGQMPSDNWFVTVNGDDILPDLHIGRLTSSTLAEANDMVDKIIGYDQNPPDDSWNKQTMLVADDGESSFEDISEQLANTLSAGYVANKIYAAHYPPGDPSVDIINGTNSGSLLVNYSGHGDFSRWGRWNNNSDNIFDLDDLDGLSNSGKFPVVTVANCWNGFFVSPFTNSLAEEFLRLKDKGAVGVWAPTSLGYPSGHRALIGGFYEAVFQDEQFAVGAAVTSAKISAYAENVIFGELVETFVFFGDPATQLGGATAPDDGGDGGDGDQKIYLPLVIK